MISHEWGKDWEVFELIKMHLPSIPRRTKENYLIQYWNLLTHSLQVHVAHWKTNLNDLHPSYPKADAQNMLKTIPKDNAAYFGTRLGNFNVPLAWLILILISAS